MKAKLTIRTSPKLRDDYHQACKNREISANQDILNYMRRTVRKYI